jgi:molybdopterin converting factor small subunit
MVTVHVRYFNMLRRTAGVEHESIVLGTSTLLAALEQIGERHGPRLRAMLFSADGEPSPHLVIFCNKRLVGRDQLDRVLAEGDELMLFPAISGGALPIYRKEESGCPRP